MPEKLELGDLKVAAGRRPRPDRIDLTAIRRDRRSLHSRGEWITSTLPFSFPNRGTTHEESHRCVPVRRGGLGGPRAARRRRPTKIVLIAGRPSHGPGEHEFNAGTKLLVECLKHVEGIEPVFVAGGWPEDESVFEGAKSVVFFMDGGAGHPMIQGKSAWRRCAG